MSYNLLKGKRGIIFGALDENSILGKQLVFMKKENFCFNKCSIAMRMGQITYWLKTSSEVIPADATSIEDLENL